MSQNEISLIHHKNIVSLSLFVISDFQFGNVLTQSPNIIEFMYAGI